MANTIVPAELLQSSGGNIKIGSTAGDSVTTGTDNVVIGDTAGTAVTTGAHNTLIGDNSGGALTGTVAAAGNNTFSPYVVVNYIIKH